MVKANLHAIFLTRLHSEEYFELYFKKDEDKLRFHDDEIIAET